MAIVEALKHWRAHAHGKRFTARSDHNPLERLFTQERISKRQARWLETLSDFDFRIKRIRGKGSKAADALSRQLFAPNENSSERLLAEACNKILPAKMETLAPSINSVTAATLKRDELAKIADARQADGLFQERLQNPSAPRERRGGLLCFDDRLCAPKGRLRRILLRERHDARAAGHLGSRKAAQRLKKKCCWPSLATDAHEHAASCLPLQKRKSVSQKKQCLLQPLQMPERKWGSVSMGFVMPLPETPRGHGAMLACVGRLTKTACFIPTKQTADAPTVAKLRHDRVFRHHCMPDEVVSDRDPRFTSELWQALGDCLEVKLAMSAARHPQANGQPERASRALEEMIRSRISAARDDWNETLVDLELACSSSVNDAAKRAPFFLNCGVGPKSAHDILLPRAANGATRARIKKIAAAAEEAKDAIKKAQEAQKSNAGKARRGAQLQAGDSALLSAKGLALPAPSACARKLLPKCAGPLEIVAKCGAFSCKLSLPPLRSCHDALHVDKLGRRKRSPDALSDQPPPPPGAFDDGRAEQEAEQIISRRLRKKRGRKRKGQQERPKKLQLLARCKGFGSHADQWIDEERLESCVEAIEERKLRVETPHGGSGVRASCARPLQHSA